MDGHLFTLICCKSCIDVCLKKTENKRKRGRGWPIFKNVFLSIKRDLEQSKRKKEANLASRRCGQNAHFVLRQSKFESQCGL